MTGEFPNWDENRDRIAECAKDMIHRHYRGVNPREPQIFQELGGGLPLEQTAAGHFLGLSPDSTPNSTSNPASSSSAGAPGREGENAKQPESPNSEEELPSQDMREQDEPDQEPRREDPPGSPPSSDGASEQGASGQANKEERPWGDFWLDLALIATKTIASNVEISFNVNGPPSHHMPMGPRYNGPLGKLEHVHSLLENLLALK